MQDLNFVSFARVTNEIYFITVEIFSVLKCLTAYLDLSLSN